MALFITEEDVKQLEHFAALSAANKLKIKEAEWKTSGEIVALIKGINTQLADSLEQFFLSYRKWYDFHVKIDNDGKQGNLDQNETKELCQLIENRDMSRNEFIERLSKVEENS